VEFILTHPFREGNGRLSRLLFDILAVQSGISGNYSPMMQLVSRLTSEANSFSLSLILFELLLNFLHRNACFDGG